MKTKLSILLFILTILSVKSQEVTNEIEKSQTEFTEWKDVEIAPLFNDCKRKKKEEKNKKCTKDKINGFIHRKLNTELISKEFDPRTLVEIRSEFIINSNGEIEDIKVNGPTETAKKNVYEIFTSIPKMSPGMNNGKVVNVKYRHFVRFYTF
ncbi:hypothetical protein [Aquimarina macrocephali]|uniref:hypothetical protein n=1 Tax=Aquimarina macrocephali TaxID=666563 RepID=UPI0004647021|nr:hypothetical protein [Aquimarina macrocephali]